MQVTNLTLWVLDNSLSEKFYKKLGFEVMESVDSHSIIKLGDFEIILVSMRDEEEFSGGSMNSNKGVGLYLYIKVDDVDEYYNTINSKGIDAVAEQRNWSWGNREFVVKDPDGYKLCFFNKDKK